MVEGLTPEDLRIEERFRRRTRNPHQSHVVLRVSPKLWKRATDKGRLYTDIQQVAVEDQTPLIQCSRCLEYGHGRKNCKESDNRCHYCGDHHIQAQCPNRLAGLPQTCSNCKKRNHFNADHAVFSTNCTIRQRNDELARKNIRYC